MRVVAAVDTGAVDGVVEPSALGGERDGVPDRLLVVHVGDHVTADASLGFDERHGFLQRRFGSSGDGDGRSQGGQGQRGRSSDAAAAAGHERDLVFQFLAHGDLSSQSLTA
jgi:hypothetical protein